MNEMTTVQQPVNPLALLPSEAQWNQIKDVAGMAVRSGLLPTSIKTVEAAAIIALKGWELGLPPMVAFSHIAVVNGKPTTSAEIMLAHIYKKYPQVEIYFDEANDNKCTLRAKRPHEKEFSTFTWDMDRARKMGLDQKDNYKKQPGTMLRWRAISEMKRVKFPEVLMGIDHTPEELGATVNSEGELVDVTPRGQQPQNANAAPEVKSVKNYAPQTMEEAEQWHKEKAERETNRQVLAKKIIEQQKRINWSNDALAFEVNAMFKKKTTELTIDEMHDFIEHLTKIQVAS